jgi:AcrR family transcriptional regulator
MESASQDIPRRLPRGSHGLDRGVVAASQRARLLEAVGRAVADKGYAAATIDDIVRGAGVSKKTFYEHFRAKQECFLAAYDAASAELFEHVSAARATQEDWIAHIRAGIHAYLRWLAGDPALARVFLIEVAAAGPHAAEHRERARDRYADLMMRGHEHAGRQRRLPFEVYQALVAAVDDLVVRRIREAGAEGLPELEPVLLYLEVALLAGPKAAAEAAGWGQ